MDTLEVMKRDRDAHRAHTLFEKCVAIKDYAKAKKTAWYLLLTHGIDVGADTGRKIIGWDKNY